MDIKKLYDTGIEMCDIYTDRKVQLMQEAYEDGTLTKIIKGGLAAGTLTAIVGNVTESPTVTAFGYGFLTMSVLYAAVTRRISKSMKEE